MRAWQFPLAEFEETLKRYDQTKPDEKKVAEYTGYVTKQWDRRFRKSLPGSEYFTTTYIDDEEGGEGGE